MSIAAVKDVRELPVMLTVQNVQNVMGLSKPKAYELVHTKGFPVIRFGRSMRVPRDRFLEWLDDRVGAQVG